MLAPVAAKEETSAPPWVASVNTAVTVVASVSVPAGRVVSTGTWTVSSVSDTTSGLMPSMDAPPPLGRKVTLSSVSPGDSKPVPVMVTVLPPVSGPPGGAIDTMTGAPKV